MADQQQAVATARTEAEQAPAQELDVAGQQRVTFVQGPVPPVSAAPAPAPAAPSASDLAFGAQTTAAAGGTAPAGDTAAGATKSASDQAFGDGARAAKPTLWQRVKALDTNGSNKLVDISIPGTQPAQATSTDDAAATDAAHAGDTKQVSATVAPIRNLATKVVGSDDRELGTASVAKNLTVGSKEANAEHALGTASAKGQVLDAQTQADGNAHMSGERLAVGGNAGATAKLIGGQVAISSRPFTHELFGEQVTAQFHVGVDAAVFAESKGQVGMEVGWTGFGAHAHLTGASNASVGLTGAATMVWAKKAPSDYAKRITQNGAWRTTLGSLVPGWILRALPDERVEGWLTELVALLITGGGGDATVLGASTTASARGALGLPELRFEGGALHCGGGAGLSFGGLGANVDLQLGRADGMQLLSLLALGGSGALFTKLMPNLSIPAFLRDHFGSAPPAKDKDRKDDGAPAADDGAKSPGSLGDRIKKLDRNGNNSLVNWQHNPDAGSKDATTKGEGHDFTYTRGKGEDKLLTGDEARSQHADFKAAAAERETAEADADAKKTSTKLQSLADKALGGERQLAKRDLGSHSVGVVDEKTIGFGGEGLYSGQVKGHALNAEVHGGGDVGVSAQKLRVGGNAGASAYLVAGQVHIETPEKQFELFGEQVSGKFEFGVDAGAFAEAQGNVNLDVGWKGAGLHADISGFAGAKAGVSAAGALKWHRKASKDYAETILKSGSWKPMFATVLPTWILNRLPDERVLAWVEHLVSMMMHGDEGDALVLGATARAEGSVGIGGAAAFSAGLRGGVLHCHGRGGLTFGVGAGANVDLALGLTDGLAMMGVMSLHGVSDLYHLVQPSMEIGQYIRQNILHLRSSPVSAEPPAPTKAAPAALPSAGPTR